jgi:hypothetical protein
MQIPIQGSGTRGEGGGRYYKIKLKKKKTFSPGAAYSQTRQNQSVASTSRQIKHNQSFVQIGIIRRTVGQRWGEGVEGLQYIGGGPQFS